MKKTLIKKMALLNNMEEEYNINVNTSAIYPTFLSYFTFITMFILTFLSIVDENSVCVVLMLGYCVNGFLLGDGIQLNIIINDSVKELKQMYEDQLIGKINNILEQ
jgi:hypothetical protein